MTQFGAISYAVAAVAYAILTILLLTSWKGRRTGAYLIGACAVSSAWGLVLSLQTASGNFNAIIVFAAEIARSGSWLLFLVDLVAVIGVSRFVRYTAILTVGAVLTAGSFLLIANPYGESTVNLGSVMIPGGLIIALLGLVLIEQLYRNVPQDARWGIKTLALGLGGIFAYDLFIYAQALLFGVLDTDTWMARGAVNLIFVPLIAVAARRNSNWDLNIFVSRHVVFYSTALIGVGLYLLVMSIGGYAIVIYGGNWGTVAQIVFFAGALVVLVFLLFSSNLRARTRVLISKHFFRNKYDYREEWLRLVSTLSEFEDSSTRQIVIKAMAQIVDSPGGVLWIYDDGDRIYHVAAEYMADATLPDLPEADPIIRLMKEDGWLIDLKEYNADPSRYGDLNLPEWLQTYKKAWLVVPLATRQRLLGFILLHTSAARRNLNYEDRDLLKTVGTHIAVQLAQEKSDSLLAEARQFEAYNRLTAFLMHDLNNLIAQQSLIVANAAKHKRNPEFVDDAMETIANSVARMKRVMEQLRRGESEHSNRPTEIRYLVSAAVDRCSGGKPVPELSSSGASGMISVDTDRFIMILTHLIKNAQDATPEDGRVCVDIGRRDGWTDISISDTGVGMSADFVRDRLFRPFDSTKGSQGMGIGAYQAREFVRKLGGDLQVRSAIGEGTTMTVVLPVAPIRGEGPEEVRGAAGGDASRLV